MNRNENRILVMVFSLASFLNDVGAYMIRPLWPLFVTSVLNANMMILGFIDGVGDALVSLSQAISGYASDRIRKRKVFIWLGYLLASLSRIGYGLSTTWQQLLVFKIIDRSGKMRDPPRDAIVADVSSRKNRGKNFGLLRMMDNLGATCGILASMLLFTHLGYRNLFILASVPSLIAVLLVFCMVKERKLERIRKTFILKDLDTNLKLFLVLSGLFYLGSFSYSFLLIYAKNFWFKESLIPVLYLILTSATSFASLPFGKLADRIGRKSVLILSYSLFGIMCLGFILAKTKTAIVVLFLLYGLHKGALEPVEKAFVSELSPVRLRSSILGTFRMIVGLCALPASFIAGTLWDKIGVFAPFCFSAILSCIAILLMMFVKER